MYEHIEKPKAMKHQVTRSDIEDKINNCRRVGDDFLAYRASGLLQRQQKKLVSPIAFNHFQPKSNPIQMVSNGEEREEANTNSEDLDKLQSRLELLGLVPGLGVFADGANVAISLLRGNYLDALINFGAMVPIAGQAVTGTKLGAKAVFTAKGALGATKTKVAGNLDAVAGLGKTTDATKVGNEFLDTRTISTDFMGGIDADDVGRLGGKLYSPKKLSQLEGYLGKRGIELRVGDEFVPPGKAGGFNSGQGVLFLRDNPTNYEVWHELSHFRQYQKIGREAYLELPRTKDFNAPEQFVFDMLENSPKRWNSLNFDEQQHAIRYIENVGGLR